MRLPRRRHRIFPPINPSLITLPIMTVEQVKRMAEMKREKDQVGLFFVLVFTLVGLLFAVGCYVAYQY